MALRKTSDIWGVVGGLGPLASAEFMKTIYEVAEAPSEQDLPRVILISDPAIPDRTASILSGDHQPLVAALTAVLQQLVDLHATRIIVCCMTMHYLLDALPAGLRSRIVSLLDILLDSVISSPERHLLLCTTGSRRVGLLDHHPKWPAAQGRIVCPDDRDQAAIHGMIYEIKRGGPCERHIVLVDALLAKYGVTSFLAACTELHLLSKRRAALSACAGTAAIDPLLIAATEYMSQCSRDQFTRGTRRYVQSHA